MYNNSKLFVAAAIVVFFSLNATAADIAAPVSKPIATSPGAKPEQRRWNQQEWDDMTPGQRMQRRKEIREHWKNMSTEERKQMRNKLNEQWKKMSPEEREARRREMHENFKNMTPEERRQFKRDMDKLDGTPPPSGKLPGGNADSTANPAK